MGRQGKISTTSCVHFKKAPDFTQMAPPAKFQNLIVNDSWMKKHDPRRNLKEDHHFLARFSVSILIALGFMALKYVISTITPTDPMPIPYIDVFSHLTHNICLSIVPVYGRCSRIGRPALGLFAISIFHNTMNPNFYLCIDDRENSCCTNERCWKQPLGDHCSRYTG